MSVSVWAVCRCVLCPAIFLDVPHSLNLLGACNFVQEIPSLCSFGHVRLMSSCSTGKVTLHPGPCTQPSRHSWFSMLIRRWIFTSKFQCWNFDSDFSHIFNTFSTSNKKCWNIDVNSTLKLRRQNILTFSALF